MALTQNQVQHVCMLYGGTQQCRYVDEDLDDDGNIVYVCKKLSPEKAIVDLEVSEFLDDMKKHGQDPVKQGVPLGDNCKGYIKLITKKQGYDLDKK